MAEIDTAAANIAASTDNQLPGDNTTARSSGSSNGWLWAVGGAVLVLFYMFMKNQNQSSTPDATTGGLIAQQTQDIAAIQELGQQIQDTNTQTQNAITQATQQTNDAVNQIATQVTQVQQSQLVAQDLQLNQEANMSQQELTFQQQQTAANAAAQQAMQQTETSIQQTEATTQAEVASLTQQTANIEQQIQQEQQLAAQQQTASTTPVSSVVSTASNYTGGGGHASVDQTNAYNQSIPTAPGTSIPTVPQGATFIPGDNATPSQMAQFDAATINGNYETAPGGGWYIF